MALAHCALSSPSLSTTTTTTIRRTLASIPPPSPSKTTKRKNFLRPKILKTLTKPLQPIENPKNLLQTLPENPVDLASSPSLAEFDSEGNHGHKEEIAFQAETNEAAAPDIQTVLTKRSVVEIVLYVVGFFVVNTLVSVWYLGSVETSKSGNEEGEDKMLNGAKKEGSLVESNRGVFVDKFEMKEKILEIMVMAREAREKEGKKLKMENLGSSVKKDDKVPILRGKTSIQKEVDGKLNTLEKRLKSDREKLIVDSVGYLNNSDSKDGKQLEKLNAKGEDEKKLVFEKKFKFKGSPVSGEHNPKGFQSAKGPSGRSGKNRSVTKGGAMKSGSTVLEIPNGGGSQGSINEKGVTLDINVLMSGNDIGRSSEKEGKILERNASENESINLRSGELQETSHGLVKPRETSELKTGNSPSFRENVESKPKRSRDKRKETENDIWWTSLPYALGILMRRNDEGEGASGLYSLKTNEGSSSYTVAFEDHHDAINFCYILDSFFQELGDVKVDIVPLSKEELVDAAKSSSTKMIVVRKGEVKLYAGQPLEDVELVLRSYIR